MTDRDLLDAASQELASIDGTCEDPDATIDRALRSIDDRRRRWHRVTSALVVVGVLCAGTTAWAAVMGHLPSWSGSPWQVDASVDGSEAAPEPARARTRSPHRDRDEPATAPPARSTEGAQPSEPEAVGPPVNVAAPSTARPPERASRPGSDRAGGNDRSDTTADRSATALYEAAHDVHFADRDFAAAARAWESYLQADPTGRFVPEARFNHAIALLHLGQHARALDELRPFAEGELGGYRADEAAALIDRFCEGDACGPEHRERNLGPMRPSTRSQLD